MLKNLVNKLSVHSAAKQMRRFASTANSAAEQELAELVAATMLARAYIEGLPAVKEHFPNGVYNGQVPAEQIQQLVAAGYETQLQQLRDSLLKSGSPNLEAVASGVSVWLYSWQALVHEDLHEDGHKLWQALEPGFAPARKLLRPIAATVKRDAEQLFFVPASLLSGYEAMSTASVVQANRSESEHSDVANNDNAVAKTG